MMSTFLVIAFICSVTAQRFTEHVIGGGNNLLRAMNVFAVDMDGDGDVDVLAFGRQLGAITWHQNNGNQSFTEHVIILDSLLVHHLTAADLDGDGDMDVIVARDKGIFWYENDGFQNFVEKIISSTHAHYVSVADVDGDGDMDAVYASRQGGGIGGVYWCENDGFQQFTKNVISLSTAYAITAVDLDGDGDLDMVVGDTTDDGLILWFENDGLQNFTEHEITTLYGYDVCVADIDADGDIDVLLPGYRGQIAWFENSNSHSFEKHLISTGEIDAISIFAKDMDGDGHMDILSHSRNIDNGRMIVWWKNDGFQNFTEHVATTSQSHPVHAVFPVDMDGDGDMDVAFVSYSDTLLGWHENIMPLQQASPTSTPTLSVSFPPVKIGNAQSCVSTQERNWGLDFIKGTKEMTFAGALKLSLKYDLTRKKLRYEQSTVTIWVVRGSTILYSTIEPLYTSEDIVTINFSNHVLATKRVKFLLDFHLEEYVNFGNGTFVEISVQDKKVHNCLRFQV